jgi:hypothetical protein
MVVPRSAVEITHDEEFTLFAVTTFKKHSSEFVHKCREMKWTPRDYKYVEGGKEEEQREVERVGKDERKVWGEALRLGRTGWSEAVMIWIHVLALRVFVETVLRYGLPLDYVCGLVKVSNKSFTFTFFCRIPRHAAPLLTRNRRRQNLQRKRGPHWTQPTRIWGAMLLAETRKEELPKTIPRYLQRWRLRELGVMAVKAASIPLTFITTLRLYKYHGNRRHIVFFGAG